MGMGVTAVGVVATISALPLVAVGVALPPDDEVSAERETTIRVSVLPGGLLLSGTF